MKFHRISTIFVSAVLAAALCVGCGGAVKPGEAENIEEGSADDMVTFRPVDCGMQAEESYDFPFLGMGMKLPDDLLKGLDSREVFAFTEEDYVDANNISYAVIRFSTTTEEQRAEEGMSVDIFSWEAALEKFGAIGVYQKETVSRLDELTACDTHEKIGESADGNYEYYLSTNTYGNQEMVEALKQSNISLEDMHEFDTNQGYTAFSEDRIEGVASVGPFTAEDVLGNTYTEEMFQEYDLTLVNAFATWCSPCIKELPELEALRQEYEKKGIKLGVVAVVMDAKVGDAKDLGAIDRGQILIDNSEAQFPFLIPDDGNMNDRLTGISSFPETFFVDKDGNIVSEPYVGARTQEDWSAIVEQELAKVTGKN